MTDTFPSPDGVTSTALVVPEPDMVAVPPVTVSSSTASPVTGSSKVSVNGIGEVPVGLAALESTVTDGLGDVVGDALRGRKVAVAGLVGDRVGADVHFHLALGVRVHGEGPWAVAGEVGRGAAVDGDVVEQEAGDGLRSRDGDLERAVLRSVGVPRTSSGRVPS